MMPFRQISFSVAIHIVNGGDHDDEDDAEHDSSSMAAMLPYRYSSSQAESSTLDQRDYYYYFSVCSREGKSRQPNSNGTTLLLKSKSWSRTNERNA
jgi:hypothetical protein